MENKQEVIFTLEGQQYGLEIMKVLCIEKYIETMKVPNTPKYIEGIINLRDEIIPIYNLRKKFNLDKKDIDDNTKIIVMQVKGVQVGFVVDSVAEIVNIENQQIEEMPSLITGISRKYIKSVAKMSDRMVILIDVDLIITDEEQAELLKLSENI